MRFDYIIATLLLTICSCSLRAMNIDDFFNNSLFDAPSVADHPEPRSRIESNPVFQSLLLPALEYGAQPAKYTNDAAQESNHKKKRKKLLLEPLKKKSPFDSSNSDDDDNEVEYKPLLAGNTRKPQQSPTPPIKDVAKGITATLLKESQRKFSDDMDGMRILDAHSYKMTILFLQYMRLKNPNFISTVSNGIADIIQMIEQETQYKFPENIVVRTKKYPLASSLSSLAFCTEYNINEAKALLCSQIPFLNNQIDKIDQNLPAASTIVQQGILAYLDALDAAASETPIERTKRIYKSAYKNYTESDI